MTATTPEKQPEWTKKAPSAYDIVACYFPEAETAADPGPKLRPALVCQVKFSAKLNLYACRVAFGTKDLDIIHRLGKDLIIQNATDLQQFDLYRATRFDLDRMANLPWITDYFEPWKGYSTPVISSLTEDYIKEYAFLMMKRQSA